MLDKEILDKVNNYIKNSYPSMLKTGYDNLDSMLSNIDKGSLITVGGRPAMGTTTFMLGVMCNLLKQNKKCLYFSLDNSKEQIVLRLISLISEVDTYILRHREYLEQNHFDKMDSAIKELSELPLYITDDCFNIQEIKEKIEEKKPDYVFINHLQFLPFLNKKQRNDAISEAIIELKRIAKDNGCIIFISSQLSKALENRMDKRPMLSDLRDSGCIEIVSDAVLFIYRDDYYSYNRDEDEIALNKGNAEIIIAKNTMGMTGIVNLIFRKDLPKFLNPNKADCDVF